MSIFLEYEIQSCDLGENCEIPGGVDNFCQSCLVNFENINSETHSTRIHPPEDLAQWRFRVSMPQSIDSFAKARVPGAQRIEFCHANRRIVIRRGWDPIAPGCIPNESDTVFALDS